METTDEDINQSLQLICTDIAKTCGLEDIDVSKLVGGDVRENCQEENVKKHFQRVGLTMTAARRNKLKPEDMFIYTNPCVLDREELFDYLLDLIEEKQSVNTPLTHSAQVERENDTPSLYDEQKQKYVLHHERILERVKAKKALSLEENKEFLCQILMPYTFNSRFLVQIHKTICQLVAMCVVEESLYMIRDNVVTVPALFHKREELYKLLYLNEISVDVAACAKSIRSDVLNAFLPPHYAVWDKENPMAYSIHPLLDCYARNDASCAKADIWHEQIKQAHTMHDYLELMRVEDILARIVLKGDNIVPVHTDMEEFLKHDVQTLRFLVCVLFVIYIHNMSQKNSGRKPLSFTRLDNADNIIFHQPSCKHVYQILPGNVFCHGGYIYVRSPDKESTVLRSKCILSLCWKLEKMNRTH